VRTQTPCPTSRFGYPPAGSARDTHRSKTSCMKNLPITWRLNIGLAIFASLGLAGVALTWWIGNENDTHRHQQTRRIVDAVRFTRELRTDLLRRDDRLAGFMERKFSSPARLELAAAEALEDSKGFTTARPSDPLLSASAKKILVAYHPAVREQERLVVESRLEIGFTNALHLFETDYFRARTRIEKQLLALEVAAAEAPHTSYKGQLTVQSMAVIVFGLFAVWIITMLRHNLVAFKDPVLQLRSALDRISSGDLTVDFKLKRKDEFADLANGIIQMTRSLAMLIGRLHQNGETVSHSAGNILSASSDQQHAVEEVEEVSEALTEGGRKIHFAANHLGSTVSLVSQASESAIRASAASMNSLAHMDRTMQAIKESAGAINGKLEILNEKAAAVSQIVVLMSKVADQTNLLSINAAIEAEKAGEYGRGFSVVAAEIQRLADQTANASEDIEQTVKEMQTAVAAGVIGTEQFGNDVRGGVEGLGELTKLVNDISHQIETMTPHMDVVLSTMRTQSDDARLLQKNSHQLHKAMKAAADSLQTVKTSATQLTTAATELDDGMSRFKFFN
jgi:methyl-accepting chemotaxis protein WspA